MQHTTTTTATTGQPKNVLNHIQCLTLEDTIRSGRNNFLGSNMNILRCVLQSVQETWKVSSANWRCMDHKTFHKLEEDSQEDRAHSQSEAHVQSCLASLLAERSTRQGTIVQQLQHVADEDKVNNRRAIDQLWAIDANWRRIYNVRYGRLMPNGVKAAFFPYFAHSARLLHSTSGSWLAADRRYSVMASGCAGSN